MVIVQGIRTTVGELKLIIYQYKEQLRRMKIVNSDEYPIIINIVNKNGDEDGWQFDTNEE
jgi:hypothetical protein